MAKPCRNGHVIGRNKYGQCIECQRIRCRRHHARHRERRNAATRAYLPTWRSKNKEKIRADNAAWRSANREQHISNAIEWRRRSWARIYSERRSDPIKKLTIDLPAAIAGMVRRGRGVKASRTTELLGCTIPEFKAYIEKQWLPGMSWTNWGKGRFCWHLDHKLPVRSFDLRDPKQQRACLHFSNYQPLWGLDNIRKRTLRK